MKTEVCGMKECSGCALCAVMCPVSCIEMQIADDGFCYPIINQEECIDCGICSAVCPSLRDISPDLNAMPIAYCGHFTHGTIYEKCTSGGAATSCALSFVSSGGVVFGLRDTPGQLPSLYPTQSPDQIISFFSGVKYFQYNITKNDITQICESTKRQKTLFIGLPCQVFSVKTAVDKNGKKENFFCIDLICQGAPSYYLVKKYRNEEEQKRRAIITRHRFRTKIDMEEPYTSLIGFDDGTTLITSRRKSDFYRAFTTNLFLRESCYCCKFTRNERTGDITVGDYRHGKLQSDSHGKLYQLSTVLVNTKKGQTLLENFINFDFQQYSRKDAVKTNLPLRKSVERPAFRKIAYRVLQMTSLRKTLMICDIKGNIKMILYKMLKMK